MRESTSVAMPTKAERNEEFLDKFAVDEVHEGGSGSFVFKGDNASQRFTKDPQRTPKEDWLMDLDKQAKFISYHDLMEEDAVSWCLANGLYEEAAQMIMSIRVYKHEEGNPACEHCAIR